MKSIRLYNGSRKANAPSKHCCPSFCGYYISLNIIGWIKKFVDINIKSRTILGQDISKYKFLHFAFLWTFWRSQMWMNFRYAKENLLFIMFSLNFFEVLICKVSGKVLRLLGRHSYDKSVDAQIYRCTVLTFDISITT